MKRVKAIFDVEVDYFLSDDKFTRYRIIFVNLSKTIWEAILSLDCSAVSHDHEGLPVDAVQCLIYFSSSVPAVW